MKLGQNKTHYIIVKQNIGPVQEWKYYLLLLFAETICKINLMSFCKGIVITKEEIFSSKIIINNCFAAAKNCNSYVILLIFFCNSAKIKFSVVQH